MISLPPSTQPAAKYVCVCMCVCAVMRFQSLLLLTKEKNDAKMIMMTGGDPNIPKPHTIYMGVFERQVRKKKIEKEEIATARKIKIRHSTWQQCPHRVSARSKKEKALKSTPLACVASTGNSRAMIPKIRVEKRDMRPNQV